jgi:hypothetical protein
MKNNRVPLFVFAPGARGDFLSSVLYGDVLETTWHQHSIDDKVKPMAHHQHCDKIHQYGPSQYRNIPVSPASLRQWYSWCIWVNTDQEAWDVAWLNFNKRPDHAELTWRTINSRYWLTKNLQTEYQRCRFDRTINYSDLWSVEFVHQMYQEIHKKELNTQQLERIQHNIKINQELLTANPFSLYNSEHSTNQDHDTVV